MKSRCNCSNSTSYRNYGGRGIKICERWNDFLCFYADMGDPPPGTSLDRIDNARDYDPGNCKWSTPKEQSNNRRGNFLVTYMDRTQTVTQWAEEYGLSGAVLKGRLKLDWPMEKALTKPKRENTPKASKGEDCEAHWKLCTFCKEYDDPANMSVSSRGQARHRECFNAYMRNLYAKRKLTHENPKNLLDL